MDNLFYKKTIALAGMIQSISVVKELAQSGRLLESSYQSLIHSLFQTNPTSILEVYSGKGGIKFGLQKLIQIFDNPSPDPRRHILKYIFSLLYLQKRLSSSPKLLNHLTERMKQMHKQVAFFHLTHPTVIDNLGDIYLNTAGKFRFRMVVWNKSRTLRADLNLNKIRALLLAGVRSAFLWRQYEGSTFNLLFDRKKIIETAENILAEMDKEELK